MNRKWFVPLGALGLVAALVFFLRPVPPPAVPVVPVAAAPAAPEPPKPPTVRTERSEPAYVAVSTPADVPAVREHSDFYRRARVLEKRATLPGPEGRWSESRLLETSGKYPLVRVVETWRTDPTTGAPTMERSEAMVADHVLARLREGRDVAGLEAYLKQVGGSIRRAVPNSSLYLIQTPGVNLEAVDVLLKKLRGPGSPLAHAEPDYVVHAHFTPDDPSFGSLWGLNNTGQTGGIADADVDAPEAWEITRGGAAVVVGVIDSGIDYTHPDLAPNIWINAGEIPGNGVDDDVNGYIDDVRGWDFVNGDNDPRDDHYHGTHCAGTIGAVGHNGRGVAGVCHSVRLMALKFLSATGSGFDSDAIEAILYATANGATLTSNSWGGPGYSQSLKDAIDAAGAAGILFVAAAGNSAHDNDTQPDYPSSFASPNLLAVAATDHRDTLAGFSNFGVNTVHLAAPGVSIYSTIPGGGYGTLSGTSMATPHVAGACALLKAARPSLTGAAMRSAILSSVDGLAPLSGKVKTDGRLNVARAALASAGPFLTVTSLALRDAGLPGAAGNGDGIVNPGEDIAIPIAVRNVGSEGVTGLSSRLRCVGAVPYIWITRGTHTWGALASNAGAETGATPFALRVSPQAVTPFTFTLRLTTTDGAGRTWTSDAECTVHTSATLSGKVTVLATGAPIAGATVTANSVAALTAITGADGAYSLAVTDGGYTLQASAPGFNASAPRDTTAPPSRTGLDFALGRSRLQVAPTSLSVTQSEDQVRTRTLTVSNEGNLPLTVSPALAAVPVAPPPAPRLGIVLHRLDEARDSAGAVDWARFAPDALTIAAGQSATVEVTFDSTRLDGGLYRASLDLYSNDPANPVTSVPLALTVELTPNTPPVAHSQTVTLAENATASVLLDGTDADGHPLTAFITQLPARGTLYQTADGTTRGGAITTAPAIVLNAQRRVLYAPPADANGAPLTTFQFILRDQRSSSNTATVTLNVAAVNDPPVAQDDTASGLPGQTLAAIAVLANDRDPDGDPLTITGFTQGARGAVSSDGDGTLRYTPGAAFTKGTDTFTYTVSDGRGASATGSVAVSLGYLSAGPWPMLGGNAAHTGSYPAALAGQPFALNWEVSTGFYHDANHLPIADGKVFVTRAFSGGLYDPSPTIAIDLATGVEVWRAATPSARAYSGASYHAGRIYFQSNDHGSAANFWCLDATTGATVYATPTQGQGLHFLPPTVTDSTVFMAGGAYGGLHGFDRATGQRLFLYDFDFAEEWTPTVGTDAVFSCVGDVLFSHQPATGAKNWEHLVESGFQYLYDAATPVFENGRVYLAGQTGLYCIAVTGASAPAQVWKVAGNFTGIPAVGQGRVCAITRNDFGVQAYDAAAGASLGGYATPNAYLRSQPIVTQDALIVSSDDRTFVFDLVTRALLQTLPTGGRISLASGALVLCDSDGMVRSYSVGGAANRAPVAEPVSATGAEDAPVVVTLAGTDADGDPLTALIVELPTRGALFQTADGVQPGAPILAVPARVQHPQHKVIYQPAPDGFGSAYASFLFKVNDGAINSAAATATVNLTGVNDPPRAVDDLVQLRAGEILDSFFPTSNDHDPDGEILEVIAFTQPTRGAVSQNADGSLRYTPQPGFIEGSDAFQYTLRDAAGFTASATVEIVVSASLGRDWPTFGGAPDHPGRYPGALGTAPLVERWSTPTGAAIHPLAVAEGRVFYTVLRHTSETIDAVALDAVTGAEVWRTPFQPGTLNPPSYFAGALYLQHDSLYSDQRLWALHAADGSVKWQAPYADQSSDYLAPAVSALGALVGGGFYGGMYGFDSATGAEKFFLELDFSRDWTPSIHQGAVYSFGAGNFRRHDPATGAALWTLSFGSYPISGVGPSTVAFDAGRAFVIADAETGGAQLLAIDLVTRAVLWRVMGSFTGTPAIADGIVHALSDSGVLTFGSSSGTALGSYAVPLGESFYGSAPVVAGDVIVAAGYAKTFLFNRATRQLIQTLPFGSRPAIADGVLFLACADNMVRAYGRIPPGNRAPVANAASVAMQEDAAVVVPLAATDADGDAVSFAIRSLPAQGTLYQTADGTTRGSAITRVPAHVLHPGGRVIYQPAPDVFGTGADGFTFTAHDRHASSAEAAVQFDIAPINDPPLAIADLIAVRPGQSLRAFHPEANDRDPDDTALTVIAFTQGASGLVTQNADGSLEYTPDAGFTGSDTFDYTLRDAAGLVSTSTVTVRVSATLGREWPTFGNGPDHTGFQPVALGGANFALRWAIDAGKPLHQIAVAAGRAYVAQQLFYGGSGYSIFTLDAPTGAEVWRVNYTGGHLNPPSAQGGDVLLQHANGASSRLFVLDGATGANRWSSPFAAPVAAYLAPVADESSVFIAGGNSGGLYGFQRATGTQLFFASLDPHTHWTPTLHRGGLYSFVAGKFRSHDRSTGAVLWTLDFGWDGSANANRTVACADDRAFLVNDSLTNPRGEQELIAVDLATHSIAWKVRGKFIGTPAVAHRTVFALSGGKVNAYDAATGQFLGACTAPGETALWWQPIVAHDALVACSETKTYIFDLRSRALRQTLPHGGYASLAGETLYLASSDRFVRAFAVPDPFNLPPTAQPLARTTLEDLPLAIALQAADPENAPLTFVISRLPTAGALYQTTDGSTLGPRIGTVPALVTSAPARVIYVPPQDRHGAMLGEFGYAASDGSGLSAEAAVTIAVTPVNDPPIAVADAWQTQPGQILSPLRERLNDLDVDGDAFSVVGFTQPSAGSVVQNADGTLRYHPPPGATSGIEQFTYTLEDAAGARGTGTVSVTVVPQMPGHWPTFGNGPDHTGSTSAALGRTGWTQRWSYAGPLGANQVAIAGGKVFASFRSQYGSVPTVVALHEKTGAQLWKRTFAAASSMNPPTYFGGRIFIQRVNHNNDTQLLALNADTGTTAWSAPHGAQYEHYLAPAVSDLGVFVNAGYGGGLYGFRVENGAPLFSQYLPQVDQWTLALLGSELFSLVYGRLTSHEPATGVARWSVDAGWGGSSYYGYRTVALAGRSAFFASDSPTPTRDDEDLVAVNLDTHTVAWTVTGQFTGTPAIDSGLVYAIGANTVSVHSALDGRRFATFTAPAGEALTGQPLLTDDLVLAQSSTKTFVWSRYDQVLVQTLNRGGTMSAADDQLIVSNSDGVITAYAAAPAVTFTPPGGIFSQPVDVTLTAATAGARLYYTTDGSAPDLASPSLLSGQGVRVSFTGKVRAISVLGSAISRIHEASFTMTSLDGDALPDWWETAHFGTLAATDGTGDSDGDGAADLAEFAAGTDPRDQRDVLAVWHCARVAEGLELAWLSKADRLYVIESSPDCTTWTAASAPIAGDGSVLTVVQPIAGAERCFFRVRALPR